MDTKHPKKLHGYTKAVKLVVTSKEKVRGKYRYTIAGVLVSDTPLPNLLIDGSESVVLEGADLEGEYYLRHKIEALFEALAKLQARKVAPGKEKTMEQFLPNLKDV